MSDLNFDKQPQQENSGNPMENAYPPPPPLPADVWGMTQNTYLMLMHLSQLLTASGLGIIIPIVMWACNKDKYPEIDAQGKIVINWIISFIIYMVVSVLLCLVLIGILLVIALGIIGVVFPIIGAVKANNGERWKYPLSIPFFKVD